MKKTTIMFAVVGMLSALQSQAALTIHFDGTYDHPTGGGPIGVALNGTTTFNSVNFSFDDSKFTTFCVEKHVIVYVPRDYDATLDFAAQGGGDGAVSGADPISIGTAYLYRQWIAGNTTLNNKGTEVQQAIWTLEDEQTDVIPKDIDDFLKAGLPNTDWKADAKGAYGVYAVNVWANADHTGDLQSQLVAVPEPNTLIAGALVLLPFTLSMVRSFRRKS